MRLITWKQVGVIASVIWVGLGPSYFHLNREDNDKRIARDQYERCIKQAWTTKGGVERCNKDLRQTLAAARWTSWAQLALIPLVLAWLMAWGLFLMVKRLTDRPQWRSGQLRQWGSEQRSQKADVENIGAVVANIDGKENHFPAARTVEIIPDGVEVVDTNGQSPTTATKEISLHQQRKAGEELQLARAKAIQSFATLEQSLASLFTHLLSTSPEKAGVVFFKISDSRARLDIIEALLKKTHEGRYNLFWNSMRKLLKELIQERNQIVHWQTAIHIGNEPAKVTLIPPNIWDLDANSHQKSAEDMRAFETKTNFVTRFLNMFLVLINGSLKKVEAEAPWDVLCRQAVTYPPPKDHPLLGEEKDPPLPV